jgi:hypothetical protein
VLLTIDLFMLQIASVSINRFTIVKIWLIYKPLYNKKYAIKKNTSLMF